MSVEEYGEGDTMGLLLAELAVTALFVGLGVLFSKGKGAFLIAGYNTGGLSHRRVQHHVQGEKGPVR